MLPFNQPFDYPGGWSFGLSERREAAGERSDLRDVCRALKEAGYRFCRVGYRPLAHRFLDLADRPRGRTAGAPGAHRGRDLHALDRAGFDTEAVAMLNRCAASGDLVVVYGYPHSSRSGNPQDEKWLIPFLKQPRRHLDEASIRACLPREMEEGA